MGESHGPGGGHPQPLQVHRPAAGPGYSAVLPAGPVLQPGDRPVHPGGHLPGRWAQSVCLLCQ